MNFESIRRDIFMIDAEVLSGIILLAIICFSVDKISPISA